MRGLESRLVLDGNNMWVEMWLGGNSGVAQVGFLVAETVPTLVSALLLTQTFRGGNLLKI